jgi:hypothetical protein
VTATAIAAAAAVTHQAALQAHQHLTLLRWQQLRQQRGEQHRPL